MGAGFRVGARVGDGVGFSVGSAVGSAVGAAVGSTVGARLIRCVVVAVADCGMNFVGVTAIVVSIDVTAVVCIVFSSTDRSAIALVEQPPKKVHRNQKNSIISRADSVRLRYQNSDPVVSNRCKGCPSR